MRALLLLSFMLGGSASAAPDIRTVVRPGDGITLVQEIVVDAGRVAAAVPRAKSRVIYLNREGIVLEPGASNSRSNRSGLIAKQASIPAWQVSPELWSETVTCVREMFAPFDVAVTERDPGDVDHIEAVFGGSALMLGLPVRAGGVAPRSTTCNVIENAIVFAFTDDLPASSKTICEVMAQEIAHGYGLDHELLAEDPMTYLSYAGARSFQNVAAECGELTPRACGVPGYASCGAVQNSYALLAERLGEAGANQTGTSTESSTAAADDDAAIGCSTGRDQGGWIGLLVLVVGTRRGRSGVTRWRVSTTRYFRGRR